jgi:large subunit ribosomal protein L7/L12
MAKVVQLIEEIKGLSLLEAAELVKELKEAFGIGDMPMMAAPAAGAASAAPVEAEAAKAEYKVTLKDGGAKKIDVIKAVKKVTNWGLTEAKKAVEEAPTVIMETMPKAEAEKLKKELEAAGATVELS